MTNRSDAELIGDECDALKALLVEKSKAYGASWRDPVRVFSHADPVEQLRVRIDDKLSRLMRGDPASNNGEDITLDLLGYLVLLRIATKSEVTALPGQGELPERQERDLRKVLKVPEGWNDPRQEPRDTDGRVVGPEPPVCHDTSEHVCSFRREDQDALRASQEQEMDRFLATQEPKPDVDMDVIRGKARAAKDAIDRLMADPARYRAPESRPVRVMSPMTVEPEMVDDVADDSRVVGYVPPMEPTCGLCGKATSGEMECCSQKCAEELHDLRLAEQARRDAQSAVADHAHEEFKLDHDMQDGSRVVGYVSRDTMYKADLTALAAGLGESCHTDVGTKVLAMLDQLRQERDANMTTVRELQAKLDHGVKKGADARAQLSSIRYDIGAERDTRPLPELFKAMKERAEATERQRDEARAHLDSMSTRHAELIATMQRFGVQDWTNDDYGAPTYRALREENAKLKAALDKLEEGTVPSKP